MLAALFDFDGTLYSGHIWRDLVRHHLAAKHHRRWTAAYVAWNMLPFPLYKMGLMSQATFFRTWAETMSWLVRGWTVDEARALFTWLTEEQIMPNLRPDVLIWLRQHRAEGHLVVLVSGTFAPWLEMIAQRLDVPHAIGTRLELCNERYTGRILPPLCQGEGKLERAKAYLAEKGLEVDWTASFAYADRNSDMPLLNQVGHPVAVYPDEALLAHAQAQGWPVIGGDSP